MTETSSETAIARAHMVDSQVRPNQVNDARVIAAMRSLARETFAPGHSHPYADAEIDLGGGRAMLSPLLIAKLTQLVLASNPPHILVIGAGTGYGAAILASSGAVVTALESQTSLTPGPVPANVTFVNGKLAAGWPANGPYEAILIEGAVPEIPASLASQLAPEGVVVAILADPASGFGNRAPLGHAVIAKPSGGQFATTKIFDCTAKILPEFEVAPAFVF
ncbi:MAG TPA: protein-L-isoaspartate O-methyltransferase [Acidocella sp.]|nr:protein-L-isoaspartate O-methyltransferase [Acidocella sp.]HQU04446.1 protein-L-isoaspartate O-methyltransferase [Acidocella sp.]